MANREPRGTSVADALAAMQLIDMAMDAICNTAPKAVAEMGGRDSVKAACQMTCVGPVPRLDQGHWSAMAVEYYDKIKHDGFKNYVGSVGCGPKSQVGDNSTCGLGFAGAFTQ